MPLRVELPEAALSRSSSSPTTATTGRRSSPATRGRASVRRADPARRGKGQALDWFLRSQHAAYGGVDAVVMIDADTLVRRGFPEGDRREPEASGRTGGAGVLRRIERAARTGGAASLGRLPRLQPPEAGRPQPSGGTAGLRGNGMGFRKAVLRERVARLFDRRGLRVLLEAPPRRHNRPLQPGRHGLLRHARRAEGRRDAEDAMGGRLRHERNVHRADPARLEDRPAPATWTPSPTLSSRPLRVLVLGQILFFAAALFLRSWLAVPLACCFRVDVFYVCLRPYPQKGGRGRMASLLQGASLRAVEGVALFQDEKPGRNRLESGPRGRRASRKACSGWAPPRISGA